MSKANNGNPIAIYNNGGIYHAIYFHDTTKTLYHDDYNWMTKNNSYATEQQKQLLFDALAKEGLHWNAETKQIEKLKWRAKQGGIYWTFNQQEIFDTNDSKYEIDNERYNNGFYFQTEQQAEEAFKKVKELLLSL